MRCRRLCWSEVTDGDGGGGPSVGLTGQTIGEYFLLGEAVDSDLGYQRYDAIDQRTETPVRISLIEHVNDVDAVHKTIENELETLAAASVSGLLMPLPLDELVTWSFHRRTLTGEHFSPSAPPAEEAILPRVAMRIVTEVLAPLQTLRANLIHVGISPDSILLRKDDMGVERALLSGFALRHVLALDQANQRDPSGCRARPEYIAPEIVAGRALTPQTDLYLVGLSFYEMLTGRTTFSSGDFRKTARQHAISRPLSPRIVRRQAQIPRDLDHW